KVVDAAPQRVLDVGDADGADRRMRRAVIGAGEHMGKRHGRCLLETTSYGGSEIPFVLTASPSREFLNQNHTTLMIALVSYRFRSSHHNLPLGPANFGIGTRVRPRPSRDTPCPHPAWSRCAATCRAMLMA